MDKASNRQGTKHWSAEEARAVLDDLASSGMEIPEFCLRRGFHPNRVRRWKQRLAEEAGATRLPAFVPVRVKGSEPTLGLAAPVIEVVAEGGFVVRIQPGCSTEAMRSVFTALREVSQC